MKTPAVEFYTTRTSKCTFKLHEKKMEETKPKTTFSFWKSTVSNPGVLPS